MHRVCHLLLRIRRLSSVLNLIQTRKNGRSRLELPVIRHLDRQAAIETGKQQVVKASLCLNPLRQPDLTIDLSLLETKARVLLDVHEQPSPHLEGALEMAFNLANHMVLLVNPYGTHEIAEHLLLAILGLGLRIARVVYDDCVSIVELYAPSVRECAQFQDASGCH